MAAQDLIRALHPVADDHLPLQRLYHFEETAPDRICFTQPMGNGAVRDMTWAEVMHDARRMAAHLRSLGHPPGARIALLSKNCAHWLIADFAIWLAGYVSVPLYPTLAAGTVQQILGHSEAKLLFVGKLDVWESMRPGVPRDLPCIGLPITAAPGLARWDDIVAATPPLPGWPTRAADDLATIIYTSGTTGDSKGAMHTFRSLTWALRSGIRRIPLDGESRMLSYLPLAHVAERALMEFGMLATGAHIFFAESLDTFVADLQRARPTVFFSVPRLWLKFQENISLKLPPRKLKLLLRIPGVSGLIKRKLLQALGLDRCVFAVGGAAPMPVDVIHWFAALGLPIAEGYGMTENGGLSHITSPDRMRPGTVGWTIDEVGCRIDMPSGEIQLRTGGAMSGYFKDPQATQEAFTADGWLRTGDTGEIDREGALRITGRVKDSFKTSKGKFVAPAPIEAKLAAIPGVESCAVVGSGLPQPIGLVVLNEATTALVRDAARRKDWQGLFDGTLKTINMQVDPHERLACIAVVEGPWTVDNGLVTPTLKVRRSRVEAFYAHRYEAWLRARRPVAWEDATHG